MSELVQGCHVHICNPLLPLFPLSSTPLPLSSTCCPLLRLPEPHAPSIMELLWYVLQFLSCRKEDGVQSESLVAHPGSS